MGYLGNQLCGAATETTLVSRNLSNYFLGDIIKKKNLQTQKVCKVYQKLQQRNEYLVILGILNVVFKYVVVFRISQDDLSSFFQTF